MFSFFKRNKKPPVSCEANPLTADEVAVISAQLTEKQQLLSVALAEPVQDRGGLSRLYEEMGLLVCKLDKDQAINYLELSLSHKLTIGDGYKKLMSLYNSKRAEAARNGDGKGIDQWMDKMDEMRHVAKKVIISG